MRGRGNPSVERSYLERRSAVSKRVQALQRDVHVLIIEDEGVDASKMQTALKVMFGASAIVTVIADPKAIAVNLRGRSADIVLLDDRMADGSGAETTLPLLRSAGVKGPVILVSGLLSQARKATLARLGDIASIVHKDDADSVVLAEAILDGMERAAKPKSR
jgi:DNA-binding NarL/FixJ family response regulator